MRREVSLIILFAGLVFALDLSNITSHPSAQKGVEYGEKAKATYKSEQGESSSVKRKLMEPATQQNKSYVGLEERPYSAPPSLCGQGSVQDEKVFAKAVLSGNRLTFYYATDPYSGVLDRSFTMSGNYLCLGGVCDRWDSAGKEFRFCMRYSLAGIALSQSTEPTLNGCVDPNKNPQLPSYFAGPWISQLLNYYKSIGKPITNTRIDQPVTGYEGGSSTATYYGGKTESCSGVQSTPTQTEYFNNPYTMSDSGLYYYLTCDPAKDPTCKMTKGVVGSGEESSEVCQVERIVTPWVSSWEGGTDGRICTPGQRLYPDGYTEASVACFTGDRFFDFSSYFWLECNPDGKGYTLKGWGYWEGAPCGTAGFFPPIPQVQTIYPFNQSVPWTEVGRLSVNRSLSGEGSAEPPCISDVRPFTVKLRNTYSPPKNVLEVSIDNAPGCRYFRWSNISGLISEQIVDGCSPYEERGCELVEERWVDANGRGYQVIAHGEPVAQLSGCVEVLRDERQKTWTSSTQTNQAPPQNCSFPPKTCKTVSGAYGTTTECRQWWKKTRRYKCAIIGIEHEQGRQSITLEWLYQDVNEKISDLDRRLASQGNQGDCEEKYCVIKANQGGKANYDVVQCVRGGSTWTCPAGGAVIMEDCKCGADMKQGFGISAGTINAIHQALRDKSCN